MVLPLIAPFLASAPATLKALEPCFEQAKIGVPDAGSVDLASCATWTCEFGEMDFEGESSWSLNYVADGIHSAWRTPKSDSAIPEDSKLRFTVFPAGLRFVFTFLSMIAKAIKSVTQSPMSFIGLVYVRILFLIDGGSVSASHVYVGETIHTNFVARGKAEMTRARWFVVSYLPQFFALCEANESVRHDFVEFVKLTQLSPRSPQHDFKIRTEFRRFFPSMTLLIMHMILTGREAREQKKKFVLGFYAQPTALFAAALVQLGLLASGCTYTRFHIEAFLVCFIGVIIEQKDTTGRLLNMILYGYQFLLADSNVPDLAALSSSEKLNDDERHGNVQLSLVMSLIGELGNDLDSRLQMISDVSHSSLTVESLRQPWTNMILRLVRLDALPSSSAAAGPSTSSSDLSDSNAALSSFTLLEKGLGSSELHRVHAAFLLCGAALSTRNDAHEALAQSLGLHGLGQLHACAEGALAGAAAADSN